ncbi:hypothetical protein ACMAZF_07485 [Psychrobium sp. nBUS_13]|uniref:hypothetical protein n=1 Tax=Psychrobium sp. nBUS_13 TaxID=3395319 RepID=UPI003EB6C184
MKVVSFVLLFISMSTFAKDINLEKFKEHEVPKGKIWLLESVEPANCRVCTSDLRINGGLAIGTNSELTMYGEFEISFNSKSHSSIKLFSGTKFWLGDSRTEIKVKQLAE